MPWLTGETVQKIGVAMAEIPHGETVGYDVMIERRNEGGKPGVALVMVLSVSSPLAGQPALIAASDLPSQNPDQATVTRMVADGVLFLRGQQRALLS